MAVVARRHGIGTGQLYTWRRQLLRGAMAGFVPVELVPDAPAVAPDAQGRIDIRARGGLPAGPAPRRVPKASLADNAPTAADRRLVALYEGLVERIEALAAARAAGRAFRLAASAAELSRWRDALTRMTELEAQVTAQSAAMRKQGRLATRVEQGEEVRQLRAALDNCRAMLE